MIAALVEIHMSEFKILVEKSPDGYIAYPISLQGSIIGEGATCEDALADLKSAIRFHAATFGKQSVKVEPKILEALQIS